MSQYTEPNGPLFLQPVDPDRTEPEVVTPPPATWSEPYDYNSIFSARGA